MLVVSPFRENLIVVLHNDVRIALLYLLLYFVDLNPNEELFGKLKMYTRQVWDE
jgi:hypothetical protein